MDRIADIDIFQVDFNVARNIVHVANQLQFVTHHVERTATFQAN